MPIEHIEPNYEYRATPSAVRIYAANDQGVMYKIADVPIAAFDPGSLVEMLQKLLALSPQILQLVLTILSAFTPNPPSPPNPRPTPTPVPNPFGTSM